jgi:formylglycine-generating enzyme required for sulfatase activity
MKRERLLNYPLIVLLSGFLYSAFSPTLFAQGTSAPAPFGKYLENINGVTLELVRIPNGKFMMGNDRSPNPEEKPAHLV